MKINKLKGTYECGSSDAYENRLREVRAELIGAREMLADCFSQACSQHKDGKTTYDHLCLSTYERLQDYLVHLGIVKLEDCERR